MRTELYSTKEISEMYNIPSYKVSEGCRKLGMPLIELEVGRGYRLTKYQVTKLISYLYECDTVIKVVYVCQTDIILESKMNYLTDL